MYHGARNLLVSHSHRFFRSSAMRTVMSSTNSLRIGARVRMHQASCPVNVHISSPRYISARFNSSLSWSKMFKEELIPVPWGVIGAKIWGDRSKNPVLVIHGWKDNLASFDRLIPLLLPELKENFYFVAIDLPGHGFSSHFPPGMMYNITDMLVLYNRIFHHFNWTLPINYIGHSFGGILGFIYAATNPEAMDRFVALDALTPMLFKSSDLLGLVPRAIHETLAFEEKLKKRKPPLYTYEETLDRLLNRSIGGLDEISAKVLLSRGICEAEPGSGLFHFTHDIRVQYLPVTFFNAGQVKSLARNFRNHILYVKATDGVHYELPFVREETEKWIRSCPDAAPDREVKFLEIEGLHHVHLVSPETVAPLIIKFLS